MALTGLQEYLREMDEMAAGRVSTGDELTDYMMVIREENNQALRKTYENFRDRLNDSIGKQILVVCEDITTDPYEGRTQKTVKPTLALGVLTSEIDFNMGDGRIYVVDPKGLEVEGYKGWNDNGPNVFLRMEKHAMKDYGEKWEINQGGVIIPSYLFQEFNPNGKRTRSDPVFVTTSHMLSNSRRNLLVSIGEENARNYFKGSGLEKDEFASYDEAVKLLAA